MKTKIITLLITIMVLIFPTQVLANLQEISNITWQKDCSITFNKVENATAYKYNFSENDNKKPTTLFDINNLSCENNNVHFYPSEAIQHFKAPKTAVYRVWIVALDENNNELTSLTKSVGGKIITFNQLSKPKNVKFTNNIGTWDNVKNSKNYQIELYEEENETPLVTISSEINNYDFSQYIELEKKYYFKVKAINQNSTYIDSDYSTSNIFTPSLHNIFTSSDNGTINIYQNNILIQQSEKDQELKITITPNEGYINNSVSICKYDDNSVTIELTPENTFIMPDYDILITATFLKKAETPSIEFQATDYDSGILKKSGNSDIKYSIDNKNTWILMTESSVYLQNISTANGIIAYTPKNNETTFADSDFNTLPINRAPTPQNLVAVSPTSNSNTNGKIVGISSSMQYKSSSDNTWIDCKNSNAIENLEPGTYEVREKPFGSILASKSVSLKITKYQEPEEEEEKSVNRYEILVIQSEGGTISPSTKKVRENRDCEFTITPNEGYKIKSLFIDEHNYGPLSTYKFNNVHANHTIVAVFEKIQTNETPNKTEKVENNNEVSNTDNWVNPFEDVSENSWYYKPIKFSNQNNLLNGIETNKFGPKTPMTRGMLACVLYRHSEDKTPIDSTIIFTDVKETAYYAKAISWACENNISAGMGNKIFKPNAPVTREQLITILYNYSVYLGKNVKSGTPDFSNFTDSDDIHSWAKKPLCWALENDLIKGRTTTTLAPRESATRAEVAAILMRFVDILEK